MTVPIERIVELRAVRGRIVGGELWREDPHASRLFGGPTARSVRRGHGYFTLHQIWIPSVQVGVTDRFSVGAATPLLPVFKDQPLAVTPKLQLFAGDRVQVAAGTIHLLNVDDNDIGIGNAVTTIGSHRDRGARLRL
jgi:hypothetical protein